MKGILRLIAVAALFLGLCLAGTAPAPASAVGVVSAHPVESVVNATQGEGEVSFSVRLTNGSDRRIVGITPTVSANGFSSGYKLSGPSELEARGNEIYVFLIDVNANANYGSHTVPVLFDYYYEGDKENKQQAESSVVINVSRNMVHSSATEFDIPVLDMAYKLEKGEALRAGETNGFVVTVTNRGNIMLQDVQVTLALPEVMSLDNSVAVQYVGYMGVSESKTVRFPIYVDKKAENKIHSFSVKMSALSRGSAAAFDRAIYIQVTGGEEKTASKDIEIGDISLPETAEAGDEFVMRFSVKNNGESDAEDLRIEALPEEGIINKTKNVFIEPSLKPGESKSYEVSFFSDKDKAARKSYPIRISATVGAGEGAVTASQYANIFLQKETAAGEVKNPQIIVDNYSFGRESVKAGDRFDLSIDLFNTSPEEVLNIKISLSAEGGAFVPVGSSNSFFIERMAAKERVAKRLTMAASPNAEQMTTALNVAMTYEDAEGNVFQAADVISIPVVQETSLTIDDIIAPPELYAGMQSGLEVRFYNTGKTQLRNLRVVSEGNFDTAESTSYYAGNMASGANDRYSFSFTPREEGALNGKVVFTYDDPAGDMQTMEKEFSFTVLPMMQDDPGFMPEMPAESPKSRLPLYIGAAVAAVLIIALLTLRKVLRRRRMLRETELDNEQL